MYCCSLLSPHSVTRSSQPVPGVSTRSASAHGQRRPSARKLLEESDRRLHQMQVQVCRQYPSMPVRHAHTDISLPFRAALLTVRSLVLILNWALNRFIPSTQFYTLQHSTPTPFHISSI